MIRYRRRRRAKPLTPNRRSRIYSGSSNWLKLLPQLVILVLIFFLFLYLFKSDLVRVKDIKCSYDDKQCLPLHLDLLNSYQGKVSLFLKPSRIGQQLLEIDPSLSDAKLSLSFPHTLNATLVSQSDPLVLGLVESVSPSPFPTITPEATPSSQSANQLVVSPIQTVIFALSDSYTDTVTITSKGQLISNRESAPSPVFFLTSPPDQLSSTTLAQIYLYHQELNLSAIPFTKGWFYQGNLIVHLKPSLYVVFPLDADPLTAISTLQQIRAADTIKSDRAIIDLRFNKPVVSSY